MFSLDNLNSAQRQAVVETEGPIMILAGAGSGKTRTLVTRVNYLLEQKQISPFQILGLTFSNKAAREMRERISSDTSVDIGALQITTFHSFCARTLRSEANFLGLSRNFTIYDTGESKSIVKTILSRHGISTKEVSPNEVLYFIDEIKNHGFYVGRSETDDAFELDQTGQLYQFYLDYESELHKANAVDFGGLIVGVLQLFEKFPEVLERYQDRFKYILIDEYQDTNRVQFELMRLLSEKRRNICVVGDEDQSIYSWRGADIRNILNFETIFPEVKILKLEQNYRSSKNIIEAAGHVIARNCQRKGKSMWTDNKEGESIHVIECYNDKQEAAFVAKEILKLKEKETPFKEMSVFYRTNSQSRLIEDSLRTANIPYRVVGGIKFYERKEVKDLIAYMRLVVNEKDSLAFSRVINVPARGIGATTLRKLEGEAISNNVSLWEIVDTIVDNIDEHSHLKLSAKVKSSLSEFSNLINEIKVGEKAGVLPSTLYEKILLDSGYMNFLKASKNKDYESMARIENLEELSSALKQFEQDQTRASLLGFLETITLDSSADVDALENLGEVSLMTIHGAKGLEFTHVFVTGNEENVFPSYRSLEEGETGIEEERRLFYVAMTRAMEKLYITFAQGRMLFGQLKFNGPSRFIYEIPDKYYQWKKEGQFSSMNDEGLDSFDDDFSQELASSYDEMDTIQVSKTVNRSRFPKGSKISHSLYGQGKVLDSEGFGGDEKVTIKFLDGARKKFMVKFAPLTLM